jgi:hypothetical protein
MPLTCSNTVKISDQSLLLIKNHYYCSAKNSFQMGLETGVMEYSLQITEITQSVDKACKKAKV